MADDDRHDAAARLPPPPRMKTSAGGDRLHDRAPGPPRSFAFVTPSHAPDFQRCRLLVDSIACHAPDDVRHHLIVSRRDERLFSALRSARTEVLLEEDILPSWIFRVPFVRGLWLSLKTPPLRGWILQQLLKLSVSEAIPADVYVFVDSDTFLVRPFDPRETVRDGKVPLFREKGPANVSDFNDRWHAAAATLLGVPLAGPHETNYVTNLVTWRRDALLALHARIEKTTGRPWAASVGRQLTVSEYALYGTFCEHVLGEDAGHYHSDRITTLNHWDTSPLDAAGLAALGERLAPHHVGVMISAKSGTSVEAVRAAFGL